MGNLKQNKQKKTINLNNFIEKIVNNTDKYWIKIKKNSYFNVL
jgi:hypothetical protein